MEKPLLYELRLSQTAASTGYFSCLPAEPVEIGAALDYLRRHPFDAFMHQYLLRYLGFWQTERMAATLRETPGTDPVKRALLLEACLLQERFKALSRGFDEGEIRELSRHTPLIHIKSLLAPDRNVHNAWIAVCAGNILGHELLSASSVKDLPRIPDMAIPAGSRPGDAIALTEVHASMGTRATLSETGNPTLPETFRRAMEGLADAGIGLGEEMQHISSLSPIALLRQWKLQTTVNSGRHHYTLSGIQTSYGRGFTVEQARAAYAMEIVERCSAFGNVDPGGIRGYCTDHPLRHASLSELENEGSAVLNPNDLLLEVPYENDPLFWLTGERVFPQGPEPVYLPAQCVFLFPNFDETHLFSGLGSTGLASGNSMHQARCHALLEVIERDAEATVIYRPEDCFTLTARDPRIAGLLDEYEEKGIRIQFQALDAGLGVPCYKCFVIAPDGSIVKGTAAHLNGKRALVSALTETPYPHAGAPPSKPRLENLPALSYESLPDYATGHPQTDLELLERLLLANGFRPIYVDLTRKDLGIPVVRAFVPGLALSADFDGFSRIHPRLYQRCMEHCGAPSPSAS